MCDFLIKNHNDGSIVNLSVPVFHYDLTDKLRLQDMHLSPYKIYIDNTPFPYGVINSKSKPMLNLVDFDPLNVFIMKENIYSTERELMAWGYSMLLLFAMICIVALGIGFKYWRLRNAFKRDK
jgi:hypothetical protein